MKKYLIVAFIAMQLHSSIFANNPSVETQTMRIHEVKLGESLWAVAQNYYPNQNTRKAVDFIMETNGLDTSIVQPGQILKLADTSQ